MGGRYQTVRAVIKEKPGYGAILADVPRPRPGPGEVLIEVKATSICGTDHHIYIWNEWAQNRIKPPQVMGHELAGEVVELGPGVKSVKVGDLVSAETHIVCGQCKQCLLGEKHVCQNTKILGVDRDGCFAEYVTVPEENLWRNDPSVPAAFLSIQEPLGNAVHTVMAGETRGRSVAVFGCGPIGLMAIGVARAVGATFVAAVDINDYRLDIARKMKADLVINAKETDPVAAIMDETRGEGVDVVLEMSGARPVFSQIFRVVRPGGRVSLLGLPDKAVDLDVSNEIVMRGIQVQGITGRRMWDTWVMTRELLQSGKLDLSPVVTHHLDLAEYAKGMDLMTSGNCGKVVLYPKGVK
ncbi:MAG TPA: L-threonine 3-dehydrogenase [Firmicutes bacterium]|nr:L-threonine 3-dehydrogenase [Candidatus Fermentithermobacillaceae bacterium]